MMHQLRIAVLGYIVRAPLGGLSWHYLQYVKGLADLGHEVVYYEDSEDYASCYDPRCFSMTTDPEFGIEYLRNAFRDLLLPIRWAYFDWHTNEWLGMDANHALRFLKEADLLLNLSGANPIRQWMNSVPVRVFVDTDPVFTQIRQIQGENARERALSHNRFVTFGEHLVRDSNGVPMGRFPWMATRQPVCARYWEAPPAALNRPYTTVMQWESYDSVKFQSQYFGMKSQSFTLVENLPNLVHPKMQIALGSSNAPRKQLRRKGWSIVNPLRIAATPARFQSYMVSSRAEFTVAKNGYVVSNCGWFSERSVNYLASGRPVVTQDTGFSELFPTGAGLFAYSTIDEAVAAIEAVEEDYERHCQAAREIAVEYFDAGKVLCKLIEDVYSSRSSYGGSGLS